MFSQVSQASILTAGEAFPGGKFIDMVRAGNSARPSLLMWDGHTHAVGQVVEHQGQRYEPRPLHDTLLHELKLPAKVGNSGSAREFLAEICKLINHFVGLPEKYTSVMGRFILATGLVDAMQTAPRLLIEGPDLGRARQLMQLLHCCCRRSLPMSAVTPAALCSLPSGMYFTLLMHQDTVSSKLAAILQASAVRGNPILHAGQLRDLFGAQAILSDAVFGDEDWVVSSIRVPCMPNGAPFKILDTEQQRRIAEDIQDKLLAYRFSNYQAASATSFDKFKFAMPLRELSASLAAATPADVDLQAQLQELLQEEDAEIRSANWVDANTVIIEAILVHCREAKKPVVYIGALAEMSSMIREGRGDSRKLDPGEVGRRIKNLGFSAEPRDEKGVKLRLSNAVCVRAHELAHQFDVPAVHNCDCKSVKL